MDFCFMFCLVRTYQSSEISELVLGKIGKFLVESSGCNLNENCDSLVVGPLYTRGEKPFGVKF